MIKLDGSYIEGGGSIARLALSLSTLMQEPFEICNIRKNRPKPGLKNQHLSCIKALEKLCNARSEGAFLGSTSLEYFPGKVSGKTIDIDMQTAGSISLFTQAVLLPSMFADKAVKYNIIGGTDAKFAAPIDYFMNVFLPHLQKFADIKCNLMKRGYFPRGGGKVELSIKPKFRLGDYGNFEDFLKELNENVPKIDLNDQGSLIQIKGISHASLDLQTANVAENQAKAAEIALGKYGCPVNIDINYSDSLSTGSGIVLWAIFSQDRGEMDSKNPIRLGADALGEKGKKAEYVGHEAALRLIREIESKVPVDRNLADQLLQFMFLTKGSIKVSDITDHVKSNIYVIEQFSGNKFSIDEENKIISWI
jgi:RNA 3'-terminal phosphate cyclase (GTP)